MNKILIFIGGLVIGGGASFVYHKNKYEKMMNEEFKEAREYRKAQQGKTVDPDEDTEEVDRQADKLIEMTKKKMEEEKNLKQAKTIINYNNYSSKENIENCPEPVKAPYVVTPEDFASLQGYDTDTYYLFENDIIADCDNNELENVEEVLGLTVRQIRGQFGVYEDDAVYIRDEKIKMDYEVLRELSDYDGENIKKE